MNTVDTKIIDKIKNMLIESWEEQVRNKYCTNQDMLQMLGNQDGGEWANEADELTDEYADMLGWDISSMYGIIDHKNWNEWRNIVNDAAKKYINKHQDDAITVRELFQICENNGCTDAGIWTHGSDIKYIGMSIESNKLFIYEKDIEECAVEMRDDIRKTTDLKIIFQK